MCARIKGRAKVGSGSHKRYQPWLVGGRWNGSGFPEKGPRSRIHTPQSKPHLYIYICYKFILYYVYVLYTLIQVYKAYIYIVVTVVVHTLSLSLSHVNSLSPALCRGAKGVRQKSLNSDTATTASLWWRVLVLYSICIMYIIIL